MTGLLRAELGRFMSRRLFRWLGVAVVALLMLQMVVAFLESSKDPDAGLAEAQASQAQCLRDQEQFRQVEGNPDIDFECDNFENFRNDERFRYAETMKDVFTGIGIFFMVLGLVAGGSFVGAEWGSGSMGVLLTWVPDRFRVLLAKWLACLIFVAAATAVILALICLLFYPVALLRGTTEGATRSFWWTLLGFGVRDVGLGLFGATVGVSLATFFRNTAGALGAGFFYGAVGDFILGIWRDGFLEKWLLRDNIARLMGLNFDIVENGGFLAEPPSAVRPAILLTCYALGFIAIAYAVFRRRDVT